MKTKQYLAALGLAMFTLAGPAAALPATGNATSGTAEHAATTAARVPRATSFGSRAEQDSYAAREVASPEAKKYKGGDVIVISATAVAIALLIVILIILL